MFHRHNGSLANGDKGRRRSRLALYKRPKANGVKPDVIHNVSTPLVSKVRGHSFIIKVNVLIQTEEEVSLGQDERKRMLFSGTEEFLLLLKYRRAVSFSFLLDAGPRF